MSAKPIPDETALRYVRIKDFLDGSTYLQNIVEDTSPQLGGNLDKNGKYIVLIITTVTTTYTVLSTDDIVICNSTTSFVATLPTAVGITGKEYDIKNINTGLITLEGDGSETIDNELNQTINQYSNITVVSDGTEWWIR